MCVKTYQLVVYIIIKECWRTITYIIIGHSSLSSFFVSQAPCFPLFHSFLRPFPPPLYSLLELLSQPLLLIQTLFPRPFMIQEMIEENLSSGEQIKTKTKFREHHRIPENFPHSLYSLSKHYSPILLAPSPPPFTPLNFSNLRPCSSK